MTMPLADPCAGGNRLPTRRSPWLEKLNRSMVVTSRYTKKRNLSLPEPGNQRTKRLGPTMVKRLPKSFHCATEFTLFILGGKWKTVILCFLTERPYRDAELRELLPKLSDKMLTGRLHDLIESGLVVRRRRGLGLAQEYRLTQRGRQLTGILRHLDAWGVENAPNFNVKVGTPLTDLDNEG